MYRRLASRLSLQYKNCRSGVLTSQKRCTQHLGVARLLSVRKKLTGVALLASHSNTLKRSRLWSCISLATRVVPDRDASWIIALQTVDGCASANTCRRSQNSSIIRELVFMYCHQLQRMIKKGRRHRLARYFKSNHRLSIDPP